MTERRAGLPAVDRVLRSAEGEALIARYGRPLVLDAVRAALDERRRGDASASTAAIAAASAASLARTMQPSQRRVFNLTGTVLHTNLGRAPLPEEAIAAATAAMRDPTTLEYDLETGARGERDNHIAGWLTRLTGAEAALAVNNNAGALVLALNTLAEGRETIVSRGELIEIGGSFRLPDIMARAGTRLREVGTTNRTHIADLPPSSLQQISPHSLANTKYRLSKISAVDRWSISAAGACRTSRPRLRRWRKEPILLPSAATNCWAGRKRGSSSAARI